MRTLKIGFAAIIFVVLTCLACDSASTGADAPDETSDPCVMAPKGDRPNWCEDDVLEEDVAVDTNVDPPECDINCSSWLMEYEQAEDWGVTTQELANTLCANKMDVDEAVCGEDKLCALVACQLGTYDFDNCAHNGCEFECPEGPTGKPTVLTDGFSGIPTADDCVDPLEPYYWLEGEWERDGDGKIVQVWIENWANPGVTVVGFSPIGTCTIQKGLDEKYLLNSELDGEPVVGHAIPPNTVEFTTPAGTTNHYSKE